MADVLWSDVTATFPADPVLAAAALGLQTAILAQVNLLDANFFWGVDDVRFKNARIYLAAHIATVLATSDGVAGPVSEDQEGAIRQAYATIPAIAAGSHAQTSYGQQFDALVRASPRRIGCVP